MSPMQSVENQISLREACISDFYFFYTIKSEESNVYWTGHDKKPEYSNLKKWFEHQLSEKKRIIFIIYFNEIKVGYCYLDIIKQNALIEIGGLAISEKFQKMRIGTIALKEFCKLVKSKYPGCELFGWWPDVNEPSIKMARRNFFFPTDETKPYFWPLENRTILTRKYVFRESIENE